MRNWPRTKACRTVKREGGERPTLRNIASSSQKKQGTLRLRVLLSQHRPTVKRVMGERHAVSRPSLTVRYESARLSAASLCPAHRAACYGGMVECTRCTREGGVYQEVYRGMYTREAYIPGYVHQGGYIPGYIHHLGYNLGMLHLGYDLGMLHLGYTTGGYTYQPGYTSGCTPTNQGIPQG